MIGRNKVNMLKNMMIGIFVLALSAGIFFILLQDKAVKDNILRSTLEMFGDELLAMVPEGDQHDLLQAKLDEFIAKAENNELSEKQVEMTVARGFNMQLSPEKPTPEEIHALFEVQPEIPLPTVPHPASGGDKWEAVPKEINEERIAHQVRKMMALNRDIMSLIQTDSAYKELPHHTMFVADSGLQIALDLNFYHTRNYEKNPQLEHLLKELSKEQAVIFLKFDEIPNIIEQALEVSAPFLPRHVRKIVIDANNQADSLNINFSTFISNPDSLQKMIKESTRILEQFDF